MRYRTIALWFLLVALPCYALDQWTKRLVSSRMDIGDGFTVIPGFFDIIHTRNTGAAFGILQGLPEQYRIWLFGSMTIVACVLLVLVFTRTGDSSWTMSAVLSLVIAGALGNLTDRLLHGEVVDFLSLHVGRFRWPTFNMADTWITLGMAGLLARTFLFRPGAGPPPTPRA
ncbi:MAG TPA: signal peptidase II [Deltaproteobacteria bacterium]|nr:signal peptidase II [Deltaproteobacteria bacterium]HPP81282.1 signal peptidase II [Deltaproteobacteria bacterium]